MKTGESKKIKTVTVQETNDEVMRVNLREDRINVEGEVVSAMTSEYGYVKTWKITARGPNNSNELGRSVLVFYNEAKKKRFFVVCSADQQFTRTGQTIMFDAVPRKNPTPEPNLEAVRGELVDGFRFGFEFQEIGNARSVAGWLCNCGLKDSMAERAADDPFLRHVQDYVDSRAQVFNFPSSRVRNPNFPRFNHPEIGMILNVQVVHEKNTTNTHNNDAWSIAILPTRFLKKRLLSTTPEV